MIGTESGYRALATIPLAVTLVILPSRGFAQSLDSIKPNQRVRVQLVSTCAQSYACRADRFTADVVANNGDTLQLRETSTHTLYPAATSQIIHLDVSQGRTNSSGQGALVGIGTGMAAAFLLSLVHKYDDPSPVVVWVYFCILTVPVGGLTGALIGATVPHERWKRVR